MHTTLHRLWGGKGSKGSPASPPEERQETLGLAEAAPGRSPGGYTEAPYMYIHMHICIYTHMYVYIHTCIVVYTYMCMDMYIFICNFFESLGTTEPEVNISGSICLVDPRDMDRFKGPSLTPIKRPVWTPMSMINMAGISNPDSNPVVESKHCARLSIVLYARNLQDSWRPWMCKDSQTHAHRSLQALHPTVF